MTTAFECLCLQCLIIRDLKCGLIFYVHILQSKWNDRSLKNFVYLQFFFELWGQIVHQYVCHLMFKQFLCNWNKERFPQTNAFCSLAVISSAISSTSVFPAGFNQEVKPRVIPTGILFCKFGLKNFCSNQSPVWVTFDHLLIQPTKKN